MEQAAVEGEDVVARATEATSRLFSKQSVPLGFENHSDAPETENRYGPTREEFLNSREEWQAVRNAPTMTQPLKECLARHRERWVAALKAPALIESFGPGRLCKIREERGFHYGKEITVGNFTADGLVKPAPWVRKHLHLGSDEVLGIDDFLSSAAPLLKLGGLRPARIVARGTAASLQLETGDLQRPALEDEAGRFLIDPPRRRVSVERETGYSRSEGELFHPPPGSAARAWRTLGLVDERGHPTARGRIFSRFQAGEGLMIAAALEDSTYPLDDTVHYLANLRGGPRFAELEGRGSDRLALASRSIYGHVDYEGYLSAGLCDGYGEATWEAIELYWSEGLRGFGDLRVSAGDIERAVLEWQSLLRHILHAPNPHAPRWEELQAAAQAALGTPKGGRIVDWSDQLPMAYRQPRIVTERRFL